MNIHDRIENDEQYQEALKVLEKMITSDPEPDSPEGKELDTLANRIGDYEKLRRWGRTDSQHVYVEHPTNRGTCWICSSPFSEHACFISPHSPSAKV